MSVKGDFGSAIGMSALPPIADMCGVNGDVRFGSKADMCSALGDVRFVPKADILGYSITSSARPISVLGTVRPSALAVLRLMMNSTLVDC